MCAFLRNKQSKSINYVGRMRNSWMFCLLIHGVTIRSAPFYATYCGNSLPTFRDIPSVPSSSVKRNRRREKEIWQVTTRFQTVSTTPWNRMGEYCQFWIQVLDGVVCLASHYSRFVLSQGAPNNPMDSLGRCQVWTERLGRHKHHSRHWKSNSDTVAGQQAA